MSRWIGREHPNAPPGAAIVTYFLIRNRFPEALRFRLTHKAVLWFWAQMIYLLTKDPQRQVAINMPAKLIKNK